MDGERLVMTKRVNCILGQESGVMHRAVVDNLEQCVVFILNIDVVQIDETVSAS